MAQGETFNLPETEGCENMAIEDIPYSVPSAVYNYSHVEADNNPTFDSSHENVHTTGGKFVSLYA